MARKAEGWTLQRDARTGIWFVRFRHAGDRYNRSTRTRDRAEAQRRATKIVDHVTTERAEPLTPAALAGIDTIRFCSEWLAAMEAETRPATLATWELYVGTHFAPFFRDAADLTSPHRLAAYVSHRLRSVKGSTVCKECSALQSMLNWAARPDIGYIEEAPTVPRPSSKAGKSALEKVRVDLTPAQVEAIIEALPVTIRAKRRGDPKRPCRAFFRVAWETGLRAGSLWRLEAPTDYHRGATELVIRDEADKAAFGRSLPLTEAARAALDEVCPERGPIFGEPMNFRGRLRTAALAAGIPEHLAGHVSPHDFRHARTTALLDDGASLTGVAYLMGHKQITTTNRYVHASREAAREALSGRETGRGGDPDAAAPGGRNAKAPGITGAFALGHEGLEPSANGLRVHCSTN